MTQNPKKKAQPAKKAATKKPAQKKSSTAKKPGPKKKATPAKKAQPRKKAQPKDVAETVVAEFAQAGENATIVAEQALDQAKNSIFARIRAWLRSAQ